MLRQFEFLNLFKRQKKTIKRAAVLLAFAFGELFLVAIGIVIAMEFDNWNEQKKSHEKFIENLSAVQEELSLNLRQLYYFRYPYSVYRKYLDSLENRTLTPKEGAEYFNLILDLQEPKISEIAYENVLRELDGSPPEFRKLRNNLNDVYINSKHELNEGFQDLKDLVSSTKKDWMAKYKWFPYLDNADTMLKYSNFYTENFNYFNSLSAYKDAYDELEYSVRKAENRIRVLLVMIWATRYDEYDLRPIFKNMGFEPCDKLSCEYVDIVEVNLPYTLPTSYIINNLSEHPVSVYWLDQKSEKFIYTIEPFSYVTKEVSFGTSTRFRWGDNHCETYLFKKPKEFVIIE